MSNQTSTTRLHAVQATFLQNYGATPTLIAQAPGRVNLIGEHTDYNDGFVFPMAIDRAIWIAARPRTDRQVNLQSLDTAELIAFSLDDITRETDGPSAYVRGVSYFLQQRYGPLTGFDGVMAGNVPIGAGLSSSAALELATLRILAALANLQWQPSEMAALAQQAEHEWVGVNCGIMDQLISATGVPGHALLIDCRSLVYTPTSLPRDTTVVVMDTNTRRGEHGLVDSAYNERRAQCEQAAHHLGVAALRDVSLDQLAAQQGEMDETIYRRAHHVVSENARVLAARDAMLADDAPALGRLMDESHISLQDDFAVSTPALDTMAAIARAHGGCYGARMTGGGFGGCAVALVATAACDDFVRDVHRRYEAALGIKPQVYVCRASTGAGLL